MGFFRIDGFLQVWLVLYTSKALQLLSTKEEWS
ncbi:BnaC04g31280D [Brassica napus]|uniref:BnaC04g31280D protein n=1 Tax=Brassica napus TaxID=3708 RepID=A0A078HLZ3_BRANA|nr:BnaC04g31280D [Brassica napus]